MSERPTNPKTKHRPADKEQSAKFIETAREIGADEGLSAADGVLGRLAKKHNA
jgi:hypothetical protein